MIHFRKGMKGICGAKITGGFLSANPKKVTCGRCLLSLEVRARKKGEKKEKKSLKNLELECTRLWRQIVWYNWDGHCALCGKPCDDKNAHHYWTKGVHAFLRYEPANSVLLCYPDHIHRIHKGIDHEKLRDILIERIGPDWFDRLKEDSWKEGKFDYDALSMIKTALEAMRDELERLWVVKQTEMK